MSTNQQYKHWRLETDHDHILWLYFDRQNASVNTINIEVMMELSTIVDQLTAQSEYRGMIIASAKKHGFIAGADINLFTKFKDIDDATQALLTGQGILSRLEALKMPVVAMIDGFCLGGGTELALACHYRVAEDSPKTRLGLPEVKLGIHPGWGGTVRLPRLIGGPQALNLILGGHTVSSKAAAKLGFVDAAVPQRHLVKAAKYYILQQPKRHKPTKLQNFTNLPVVRPFIARIIRNKVKAKADPRHYPAPFQALTNWELYGVAGEVPYEKEARSCGRLFFSETCHNLVRDFFLQERLKGLAKESQFDPKHVHVIGGGTMGGDIAAWCALRGMRVTLQDRDAKFIAPAIKRAYALFKEKLKEPNLVTQAMDRLIPDVQGLGIPKADIIIEAIYEDLKAKQALFKSIELEAKPQAVLATNTSSIPLDEINTVLQTPERLVGIHFFNPVAKMMLVEVVKGKKTDASIVEKALTFTRKLDKLPLPVKSSPGFLVNRVLMPYLLEALIMMEEGVPAYAIDKAMLNFGMPMGPVTLADTVGLDICLSVAKHLSQYYSVPIPERLTKLVEQGKLGRKTGEGFYLYKNGKQIKPKDLSYDLPLTDISDRLVLRMLDEAFACLREGVVADGDLLDAGMIFGTGFAPFRGGPIHYAKTQGIHELFEQYVKQQEALGVSSSELTPWELDAETT